MLRSKRVSVREAFCPRGCMKGSGSIHYVGSGGCGECIAFSAQNVLMQGAITFRLIALEDERSRTASTKIIPTPPPSPGKLNREITGTIKDAQNFVVNSLHQQLSGIGAVNAVRLPDDDALQAAGELKRKGAADARALAKKTKTDAETQLRQAAAATQFDVDDTNVAGGGGGALAPVFNDEQESLAPAPVPALAAAATTAMTAENASLTQMCIVGIHIEIRDSEGRGRGVFSQSVLNKGQRITYYDGHRLDVNNLHKKLICSRMSDCISNLPEDTKSDILKLQYCKIWAVTVGRKGSARIMIDGTISASTFLDSVPNRGGIGVGAIVNSTMWSNIKTNCTLVWIKRVSGHFRKSSIFYPNDGEEYDAVIVADREIAIGEELFYRYFFSRNAEVPPAPAPTAAASAVVLQVPIAATSAPVQAHIDSEKSSEKALEIFFDNVGETDLEQHDGNGDAPNEGDLDDSVSELTAAVTQPSETELECDMYGNPSNKVTCERLKKFVRGLHTKTPSVVSPEHRLKDVFNMLQQPLQAWCREQAARMKYCRMHRIKAKMSALDSVQSCMRMLTIFANYQDIRHEYLATRQVASKETLDAKAIGPDSKFWIEMHTKFLDPDEVSCWPYDHIPTVWQGKNHLTFPPPARIASGLLKGMNLEHGRRPVGFLDSFFSRAKLHQLWNDSLALYRRTHASWNSSGNNLSYPLYHFVLPVTIFDINKPHLTCGISNIQKRWDSIA